MGVQKVSLDAVVMYAKIIGWVPASLKMMV